MKHPGTHVSAQLAELLALYAQSKGVRLPTGAAPADFGALLSTLGALADGTDSGAGLRLAEEAFGLYGRNTLLMTVMANCETLGQALEKLAAYHGVTADFITFQLASRAEGIALAWRAAAALPEKFSAICMDAVAVSCVKMLQSLTAQPVGVLQVRFEHAPPADAGEYERAFCAPVAFAQSANELVFSTGALALPIRPADPGLLWVLEKYMRDELDKQRFENTVSGKVSRQITFMVLRGEAVCIGSVAVEMSMGVRTLQKLLAAEGSTYKVLVSQARESIAMERLREPDANVGDIAFLLGFSEQSAFNHAFKKWTGVSPREYMKKAASR